MQRAASLVARHLPLFAMLQDLAYTIIYVSDIDKSTAFYRDVLGIPLDYAVEGWTQFKSDGAALVLHPQVEQQKVQPGSAAHIAFRVDDLDAEYERLSAHAVKFLAPPAKAAFGKHATLLDPEGNPIDLIEWAGKPARVVSSETVVNDILKDSPEAMEVLEEHGIRICGGCIVLLNASVRETAEYSGLSAAETSELVEELSEKVNE
jgi:catechol 2,3-dioxygenase-like lactoylglutathione lyase family enzyme